MGGEDARLVQIAKASPKTHITKKYLKNPALFP